MAVWQADLNAADLADPTVSNQLADMVKILPRPLLATGLPDDAMSLDGVNNGLPLSDRTSKGFLGMNVKPCPNGGNGYDAVPVVRERELHCIQIAPGDHLAKVAVHRTVPVAVSPVDQSLGLVTMPPVDITYGYHLYFSSAKKALHIALALGADADGTHHDSIARRDCTILSQCRTGNDIRECHCARGNSCRSAQEAAPANTSTRLF